MVAKLKRSFHRVVTIADLHSGHKVGLTHPNWQYSASGNEAYTAKVQKKLFSAYDDIIEALKPIDTLIVNADCIEGKNQKKGGIECWTLDRVKQIENAADCINLAQAKKVIITRGTDYHVGPDEEWEDILKDKVHNVTKIGNHEFVEVRGVIFDVKHFLSSSVVPYGRYTSLARERIWNLLWNEKNGNPKGDIIIRSHVHYYEYCGGIINGRKWLAVSTPALQGYGSSFGTKRCSGTVDFGLMWFDVYRENVWQQEASTVEIQEQVAKLTVIE